MPAWSMNLHEAKAQGLVGETLSGYLELVDPSASGDVRALMQEINQKRKQKYGEIARRNKTNLGAIESLAGQKAIKKTKPGHLIKLDGKWKKKPGLMP
ncbi:MAG: DUF1318 domain-containing protein [Nitrospirales bacterium]|nr:DUF1318 domain-containing protein [Nitrospirales bacterium]